jgi:hypothetical protein
MRTAARVPWRGASGANQALNGLGRAGESHLKKLDELVETCVGMG